MHRASEIIFSLTIIGLAAVLVWFSPVIFKGYAASGAGSGVVLARNFSLYGISGAESKLNVVLAPELVKEQAQESSQGNKLTAIFYAKIFDIFGIPDSIERIIFISCIILAICLLILFLVVYYLFNLKTALIFALIFIFLPFNWLLPIYAMSYDVALFFLSLFWLFFILAVFKKNNEKNELRAFNNYKKDIRHYLLLIFAGCFLALTGMAKESMYIFSVFLFIYLLLVKKIKILVAIFIPFFILVILLWLPDFLSGENDYQLLLNNEKENITASKYIDYGVYAHIFPDPYTFHFDKENFLEEYRAKRKNLDLIGELGSLKVAANMGQEKIGLIDRFKVGLEILARHLGRFISLEEIGGSFVFLLFILGFYCLKKENKFLQKIFILWILGTILFLSFIFLAVRSHMMDFGWVIAAAISLGLISIAKIISEHFLFSKNKKALLSLLLVVLVLYQLVLSSHVVFGRIYDNTEFLENKIYAEKIKEKEILPNEVIAFARNSVYDLNFLTGKSFVAFNSQTIENLIQENKLQEGFDKFEVKYIVGHSPELTALILKNSNVKNISDSNINIQNDEIINYNSKVWFMNLVK